MRDRLRRGKKKPETGAPDSAQSSAPELPPLQPYLMDRDSLAGTEKPAASRPRIEEAPIAAEKQPAETQAARPSGEAPKRKRRRGRRGRGKSQMGRSSGSPRQSSGKPLQPAYPEGSGPGDLSGGSTFEAEPSHSAAPTVQKPPHHPHRQPHQRAPQQRPASHQRPESEPRPSKGVVVLAIGLPGSGKSTWFKRKDVVPLSSDMLRAMLFDDVTQQRFQDLVFSTLRSLLRARMIAGMPTNYVDATNLSPHERRSWIKMAHDFGYEVQAVFFDVPVEVCLERNRRRERVVPEDVMQRMASKLRPPKFEEGFSKVTVVRVKQKD